MGSIKVGQQSAKVFGSEHFLRGVWAYFILNRRAGARKILADAAQENHEGKQGQWQQKSPFKEVSGYRLRSPDNARCLHRKEAWQLGELLRKKTARKERSVNGPLKELGKLMRRWQWRMSAAWALRRTSEENARTSRGGSSHQSTEREV